MTVFFNENRKTARSVFQELGHLLVFVQLPEVDGDLAAGSGSRAGKNIFFFLVTAAAVVVVVIPAAVVVTVVVVVARPGILEKNEMNNSRPARNSWTTDFKAWVTLQGLIGLRLAIRDPKTLEANEISQKSTLSGNLLSRHNFSIIGL